MEYDVTCVQDGVNDAYTVMINGKLAISFPYTSWYNPSGMSATSAKAQAFELAQNLQRVLTTPAQSYVVTCVQNGLTNAYDVLVNGTVVTSYPYSGIAVIGTIISSQIRAKANGFQLAQDLTAILANKTTQ